MRIAHRLSGITDSPTMAVMQEAQDLRRRGIDVIDLGPGEPDFPTPEPIKRAGIEAISADFTKYTGAVGILELREAVAEKFNSEWGTDFGPKNVAITCGAKHAIYQVCMALLEKQDRVLIPSPYWVTFPEVVRITGADPAYVETTESQGFELETSAVAAHLDSSTRALIVNSPNNPTGAVLSESAVLKLSELCRQRKVFLVSDETYEYFVYDDHPHVSVAKTVRASDDHFGIVGSLSKTYSMTGWRVGFVVAHQDLIAKIAALQSHQTGNPTSISQKAALAALRSGGELVAPMKEEYARRRRVVLEHLEQIPGFTCARPNGAFYAFPNVSRAIKATGVADSQAFSQFLIQKARVATVPGSAFGMEGFIRLSYATSMEDLKEGLSRISSAVQEAMT